MYKKSIWVSLCMIVLIWGFVNGLPSQSVQAQFSPNDFHSEDTLDPPPTPLPTSTLIPTSTPIPTPTPVSSLQCNGLEFEAELGVPHGNFAVVLEPGASGGSYIHTPDTGEQSVIGAFRTNDDFPTNFDSYVEYCFNITEAGTYRIRSWVYASNFQNNSFQVSINGAENAAYIWDLPVNNENDVAFVLDYVSSREMEAPIELDLAIGIHTMRIYEREDGAQLDKFLLERQGDNQPPIIGHPGDQLSHAGEAQNMSIIATDPDGDGLTFSAVGLPANLTIDPTGTIVGTPESGESGTYNVIVYVDDGTSIGSVRFTWTIDAEPAGQCGGLTHEAEAGILFGKMVVGFDAAAAAGGYIHFPEQDKVPEVASATISRKHRADYCVTIPETGKYRIRTETYASSYVANSFYVQIDSGPTQGYTWDIFPADSNYNTDYVADRGGTDPLVVLLTEGTHTITFLLRENGARLDSFTLERITVSPAQTQTPTKDDILQNMIQEAFSRGQLYLQYVPMFMK